MRPRLRLPILPALLLAAGCGSPPPAEPPPQTPQVAPPPPAAAPVVERRSVVILSRPSGTSTTKRATDGSIDFAYQHLQNGRGPKFEGRARFLPDGTLAAFEAHGTHMMGNAIDETFSIENGHARWKSREEQGEKPLSGPAFYVPIAPLPDVVGMLFKALRKANGKIALLPDGEARLERVTEITAKVGGKEKKLVAWAITGLELAPTRFFTEGDETFFGTVDSWFSCVPEGWDGAIEPLLDLHKRLDAERDLAIAKKLAHSPPKGAAFVHARVLDVEKGKWLLDHTVVVDGGKIVSVGPSKTAKVPADAEVVDAKGKALLPGLWDMHSHLGLADGVLDIASGVTTARDLANDPDRLDDMKARFDDGRAVGPRVLRSGFIEGRGEKAAASKITAETEEEARSAVSFYKRRGYEGIKIYNSVKVELVPLLARLAHENGMRVSGHIPVHMRAEEAVRAGYDEIQHINMLFLNFFVDKNTDTRTPLRFSLVAEKAAGLDLESKPVKDFVKLLLEKKTVVDPTVSVFEDLFVSRPGVVLPGFVELMPRLPVQVQRWFKGGGLPVTGGQDELHKKSFAKLLAMVKALHAAKVPLVAGTDAMAGVTLHHELELYVEAGLPPADVLRIATLGAARVMKLDKDSGSIAKGKVADLVLIDGDPLARMADIRKVVTTVRGGVLFPSAELYATLGIRPWR